MNNQTISFTISPDVLALGLTGVFLTVTGMQNTESSPDFNSYRSEVLQRLSNEYSEETIKMDSVLEGFRTLHTKVGRSNRKFVSSPENLVEMFLRNGSIPSINLIVDIYNLVSLETRLALGAHDISKIDGGVHLKITDGTEKFLPLGKEKEETVSEGEYCYVDEGNDVLCRLEYRQVEKTKVTVDTTDCFFIIQGNEATTSDSVKETAERLVSLLKQYCGGEETILWQP